MKNIEKVLEIIRKTNQETEEIAKRITDQVNQDQKLNSYFSKWCTGKSEFNKRYYTVWNILQDLRSQGFDVKINMQSYQLTYHGTITQ